jgi:cyclic pyranopterin phosphate synthase
MIDGFGRTIQYLRMSVTDRCDLRCRYCMAEDMTFLPRKDILSLEEIALLADHFVARGIRKIRLTGGEPLVRQGIVDLVRRIGRHLGNGLDELTLTTNGTRLAEHADALADGGIRRINVSLDTLDPAQFRHITRHGDVAAVLDGIAAAKAVGIAVKINMVALNGLNEDQLLPMLAWCDREGHDLTLIETMPLGEVEADRTDHYVPLHAFVAPLRARHAIEPIAHRSGGPARYFKVDGHAVRLGLITPLSQNFCSDCNRIRMTVQGRIYMCLGQDDHVDLMAALRVGDDAALDRAIDAALAGKPQRHEFRIETPGAAAAVARHMSVTGG